MGCYGASGAAGAALVAVSRFRSQSYSFGNEIGSREICLRTNAREMSHESSNSTKGGVMAPKRCTCGLGC